jgi:hypothetical protein
MEAVSIANKRLLESHVRRKRSCVVWGAAVGNTGKAVRWPPTPQNTQLPLSPKTRLELLIEDLRTEEEKERDFQREVEKRSYRLPGIDESE